MRYDRGAGASSLADRLRRRRGELRLSIKEVYTRAGISRSYYYELENRLGANPAADILERLARVLETSTSYLLGGSEVVGRGLPLGGVLPELSSAAARLGLSDEDVRMLSRVHWRGRQPTTEEAWVFVAEAIRRACLD